MHPSLFGHHFESIRLICDIDASGFPSRPVNVLSQTCGTRPTLDLPTVVFVHCPVLGTCNYLYSTAPFHPINAKYYETTAQNGEDLWRLVALWPFPKVHLNAHFSVSTGNALAFQDNLTLLQLHPMLVCTENNICTPLPQIKNETSGK